MANYQFEKLFDPDEADELIPVIAPLLQKLQGTARELRTKIEFQRINFMDADHGLSARPEIIFCRNVIIYFDRPTQIRLLQKLTRQLASGGYFFAGHSESLQNMGLPLVLAGTSVYRKCE